MNRRRAAFEFVILAVMVYMAVTPPHSTNLDLWMGFCCGIQLYTLVRALTERSDG